MKTDTAAVKFLRIKLVAHVEELQLITFCENRRNVKAIALYSTENDLYTGNDPVE